MDYTYTYISFNPPPPFLQLFSLVLLCEELEQKALALLTGDREERALLLAQKDDVCSLVFSLLKLKHLQLLSSKYATGTQQVILFIIERFLSSEVINVLALSTIGK